MRTNKKVRPYFLWFFIIPSLHRILVFINSEEKKNKIEGNLIQIISKIRTCYISMKHLNKPKLPIETFHPKHI